MYFLVIIFLITNQYIYALDYGDININENKKRNTKSPEELAYENKINSELKNTNIFDEEAEKLKKTLNTNDVDSIGNIDMWKKLHKYLSTNWDTLVVDGFLKINFFVNYSFCVFIFLQIPAEVIFPIPSFYSFFIPKSAYSLPVFQTFFTKLKQFDKSVREKSKKIGLINFIIGKKINSKTDLDFILEIPKLIKNDPIKVLRWFIDFEMRSKYITFNDVKNTDL